LWYEGGALEEWVRKSAVQPAARLKLASGLGTWLVPSICMTYSNGSEYYSRQFFLYKDINLNIITCNVLKAYTIQSIIETAAVWSTSEEDSTICTIMSNNVVLWR
jgi:hypothetical protein